MGVRERQVDQERSQGGASQEINHFKKAKMATLYGKRGWGKRKVNLTPGRERFRVGGESSKVLEGATGTEGHPPASTLIC